MGRTVSEAAAYFPFDRKAWQSSCKAGTAGFPNVPKPDFYPNEYGSRFHTVWDILRRSTIKKVLPLGSQFWSIPNLNLQNPHLHPCSLLMLWFVTSPKVIPAVHWIDLWENLQESRVFKSPNGSRCCRFSLTPILRYCDDVTEPSPIVQSV